MPTLPTTPERDWKVEFTEKFTDNVIPGSPANDLYIDKEDGESLMGWIGGLLATKLTAQATKLLGEVEKMRKNTTLSHACLKSWGGCDCTDNKKYNEALDDVKRLITSLTSE